MLFKRRDPEPLADRIRVWMWPRRSWSRSISYIKARVSRLRGTPHVIALGFVVGVFVSFTPYLGLHFIIAGIIAWLIGGSIIASALGTFFGNPLTFPFIWGATYNLGNWILGAHVSNKTPPGFSDAFMQPSIESVGAIFTSFDKLWAIFKPMTVGALPLGLFFALVLYFPVRKAVEAYQTSRRRRITEGGHGHASSGRPGRGADSGRLPSASGRLPSAHGRGVRSSERRHFQAVS